MLSVPGGSSRCRGSCRCAGDRDAPSARASAVPAAAERGRASGGTAGASGRSARSGSAAEAARERDRRARGPRSHAPRCRGGGGVQTPLPCAPGALPALLPRPRSPLPERRGGVGRHSVPGNPREFVPTPQQTPPGCGSRLLPSRPTLCHPCVPPVCPPSSQLRTPLRLLWNGAGAAFGGEEELTHLGEFAGGIPGLPWEVPAAFVLCLCARTRVRGGDTGLWWEHSQSPRVCQGMFVWTWIWEGRLAREPPALPFITACSCFPFGITLSWPARLCQGNAAGAAMERGWPHAPPWLLRDTEPEHNQLFPSFPRRWMVPSDTAERFSSKTHLFLEFFFSPLLAKKNFATFLRCRRGATAAAGFHFVFLIRGHVCVDSVFDSK